MIEKLEYLPLSIVLAAVCIEMREYDVLTYIKTLDTEAKLLEIDLKNVANKEERFNKTQFAAIRLVITNMIKECDKTFDATGQYALQVLLSTSFLSPKNILFKWLESYLSHATTAKDPKEALLLGIVHLENFSLVRWNAITNPFEENATRLRVCHIHECVQKVLQLYWLEQLNKIAFQHQLNALNADLHIEMVTTGNETRSDFNKYRFVLPHFSSVLKIMRRLKLEKKLTERGYIRYWILLAKAYFSLSDTEKCIAVCQYFTQNQKTLELSLEQSAEFHLICGTALMDKKLLHAALKEFNFCNAALGEIPNKNTAHVMSLVINHYSNLRALQIAFQSTSVATQGKSVHITPLPDASNSVEIRYNISQYFHMSMNSFQCREFNKALQYVNLGLELLEKSSESDLTAGKLRYLSQKAKILAVLNPEKAKVAYESTYALYQQFGLTELNTLAVEFLHNWGNFLRLNKDYTKAIEILKLALVIDEKTVNLVANKFKTYVFLTCVSRDRQHFTESIDFAEKAIGLFAEIEEKSLFSDLMATCHLELYHIYTNPQRRNAPLATQHIDAAYQWICKKFPKKDNELLLAFLIPRMNIRIYMKDYKSYLVVLNETLYLIKIHNFKLDSDKQASIRRSIAVIYEDGQYTHYVKAMKMLYQYQYYKNPQIVYAMKKYFERASGFLHISIAQAAFATFLMLMTYRENTNLAYSSRTVGAHCNAIDRTLLQGDSKLLSILKFQLIYANAQCFNADNRKELAIIAFKSAFAVKNVQPEDTIFHSLAHGELGKLYRSKLYDSTSKNDQNELSKGLYHFKKSIPIIKEFVKSIGLQDIYSEDYSDLIKIKTIIQAAIEVMGKVMSVGSLEEKDNVDFAYAKR